MTFLKITHEIKKGTLLCLSHRNKRVEKMNLLHFSVSTLKNFLILELPESSTDSGKNQEIFQSKNWKM